MEKPDLFPYLPGNRSNESDDRVYQKNTTISDDRTEHSNLNSRMLSALTTKPTVKSKEQLDYEMQLKLLEQQSRKRIERAKEEQEKLRKEQKDKEEKNELPGNQAGVVSIMPNQLQGNMAAKEEKSSIDAQLPNRAAFSMTTPRTFNPQTDQFTHTLKEDLRSNYPRQYSSHSTSSGPVGQIITKHGLSESLFSAKQSLPLPDMGVQENGGKTYSHEDGQHGVRDSALKSINTDDDNPERSQNDMTSQWTHELSVIEAQIELLKDKAGHLKQLKSQHIPPSYFILYRLRTKDTSTVYIDAPQWVAIGKQNSWTLKSSLPVSDVSWFLEQHSDVAFVVYRDYHAEEPISSHAMGINENSNLTGNHALPPAKHSGEAIAIINESLKYALASYLKTRPELNYLANLVNASHELRRLHLFIYHARTSIQQHAEKLPESQQKQLKCLLEYISNTFREEFEVVDSLLNRGMICLRYMGYLIKPGDVIIQKDGADLMGYCATSELDQHTVQEVAREDRGYDDEFSRHHRGNIFQATHTHTNSPVVHNWKIRGMSWKFDGTFTEAAAILSLSIQSDNDGDAERRISDLDLVPLAFASPRAVEVLKTRGETMWKCRVRRFVSYHDDAQRDLQSSGNERFMIDLATYQELHPKSRFGSGSGPGGTYTRGLGSGATKRDNPPNPNFVYLQEPLIKGFNMQQKKWINLHVDKIREVTWNKEAFKSLVLEQKTKNLIEALISNQLDSERSTDLISGKGNGLILLLHGGPGTGKTLTAESVAEIAEKPLYRVTCGDIGTEPEVVEKYLESVLHLGKLWECVVLLDEADVFLEQRTLDDLQRNALVSVFLRVLEYYEGIIVLTSNRVGTFDEAFKSRIQLALRYPNLDTLKRRNIWRNFINKLETEGEKGIDFEDLRSNIDKLARTEMNGRQIRNAITTARQYTHWKKTILNYAELQEIIEISGSFDTYLDNLNGGLTQDQIAEGEGRR